MNESHVCAWDDTDTLDVCMFVLFLFFYYYFSHKYHTHNKIKAVLLFHTSQNLTPNLYGRDGLYYTVPQQKFDFVVQLMCSADEVLQ